MSSGGEIRNEQGVALSGRVRECTRGAMAFNRGSNGEHTEKK